MEDLEAYVRVAKGRIEDSVEVREGGLSFLADVTGGQKTGRFYDQRENRAFVAGLAHGGRMLDLYCYGGAFAVSAAAAGARAVSAVDRSQAALALGRRAAERNGVAERCAFARADAFEELDRLHGAGERFDVVAADPPAFVRARKDLRSGRQGLPEAGPHGGRPGSARRLPVHRIVLLQRRGRALRRRGGPRRREGGADGANHPRRRRPAPTTRYIPSWPKPPT